MHGHVCMLFDLCAIERALVFASACGVDYNTEHALAHAPSLAPCVMSFMRADNHMCVIQLNYVRPGLQYRVYYAAHVVR